MRSARALVWLAGLALAVPAGAKGPSFDCAKARAADEKAVCASPQLAALDARLAGLFARVQACSAMGSRDVNNSQQGAWLRKRAKCGANRACIASLYKARIAQYAPRAAAARQRDAVDECPGPV